ncbi:MAG: glycosyltransferase family 2 protein [Syntrophomonadaceae bacterium]|nr:glycosyltransferase family 2 protein [Syntrophomonadaceae bacterium]
MSKLSILMPVYNEEKFIYEAVNSILNQDCNFELIIVNDGSTDRTGEILKEFDSPKLRILNSIKIGKNAAINKAYQMAEGEWFAFFAGDDIMPPGSLKDRLSAIEHYDTDDLVVGLSRLEIQSEDKRYNGIQVPKNKSKGYATGSTVIFSKAYANLIFPIPEDYPNEDGWTGLHFQYFSGTTVHIPINSVIYRIHSGNSMQRTTDFNVVNAQLHSRNKIYAEFANRYKERLEIGAIEALNSKIRVEELRYQGKTLRLALSKGLPMKDKMRAIFYSNRVLYQIKHQFARFFIGW